MNKLSTERIESATNLISPAMQPIMDLPHSIQNTNLILRWFSHLTENCYVVWKNQGSHDGF